MSAQILLTVLSFADGSPAGLHGLSLVSGPAA